jgi:hypothetical protein
MNMIRHAADDQRLAIMVGQYAAKVTVQCFAHRFIAQERMAVFG